MGSGNLIGVGMGRRVIKTQTQKQKIRQSGSITSENLGRTWNGQWRVIQIIQTQLRMQKLYMAIR